MPDTGAATFEVLGEAGAIPPDLAAALARMVGFRNILVHDYVRLDPTIVVRAPTRARPYGVVVGRHDEP